MRRPTSPDAAYRWYGEALAGKSPAITHEPECGWFKRRFIRNGPWLPARIWLESPVNEEGELVGDEVLRCEVAGKARDPVDQWTSLAGQPITEYEFHYLMALKSWADAHAQDHPIARPHEAVDFLTAPIPF